MTSPMDVLILSNSDISGGAARASYRLHQGLHSIGINSQMLVQEKYVSEDKTIISPKSRLLQSVARTRVALDSFPLKFYSHREETTFSIGWLPDSILPKINKINPDIINLHWINAGFIQTATLAKMKQPLIWTLHDMWPFTGGCHYSQGCSRYKSLCGACPQLNSQQQRDLSRCVWLHKTKAWRNINLTIVSPSTWLADCARSSSLFKNLRIEVIPNSVDTHIYRPIDQQTARKLLFLPQNKRLILFGSLLATNDPRKGFHLLQKALNELRTTNINNELELVVFGASKPNNFPSIDFKTHFLGTLSDDLALALAYSAADVFVLPSTQENLANTIIEALACGVPCVAFNTGGMADMIEHQVNGYLAIPYDIKELAEGVSWVLGNQKRKKELSLCARKKAKNEYSLEIQASRYNNLYSDILATPSGST